MPSRRSFQLVLFSMLVMSSPTSSASFSSTSAFERLPICSEQNANLHKNPRSALQLIYYFQQAS